MLGLKLRSMKGLDGLVVVYGEEVEEILDGFVVVYWEEEEGRLNVLWTGQEACRLWFMTLDSLLYSSLPKIIHTLS